MTGWVVAVVLWFAVVALWYWAQKDGEVVERQRGKLTNSERKDDDDDWQSGERAS